jgi:hypothetical protein
MDVRLKNLRGPALQVKRDVTISRSPMPMRKPVSLDCSVALEEQKRLDQPARSGIALDNGGKIGARRLSDRVVSQERFEKQVFEVLARERGMAEPSNEISGKRFLKASGSKDASIERRKHRLAHSHLRCFGLQSTQGCLIWAARFRRFARERIAAQRWKIGLHSALMEGHLQHAVDEILTPSPSFGIIFLKKLPFIKKITNGIQIKLIA